MNNVKKPSLLGKNTSSQIPISNGMRVLAIDPGYERVGFAVLEKDDLSKEVLLYSDCFKTSAKLPFPSRLKLIGDEMLSIIKKYNPNTCAVEKLYFHTNQKTAMSVSEARGIFLYIAENTGLSIHEYTR